VAGRRRVINTVTDQSMQSNRGETNAEVRGAISAFEQILQAIPNDRAAMDAIFHAYDEVGDTAKAADYLFRLVRTMVDEGDFGQARGLLANAPAYAEDARAAELVATIEALAGFAQPVASPPVPPAPVLEAPQAPQPAADDPGTPYTEPPPETSRAPLAAAHLSAFDMSSELAFAWNMLEAGDLTQEEYSGVVQDLTEMSVAEGADTVSVLHVLENRGHRGLEHILTRAADECGTPVVSLSCFNVKAASDVVLPVDFMLRRGALVFELIGDHALVVVLNPYDEQLRTDIETLVGRPCHFYLSLPSEFDEALTRLSDVQAGKVKAGD
jgi:hypothetical protein